MKITSILTILICLSSAIDSHSQSKNQPTSEPVNLLDNNLSYWYKWIGVPHTSVEGLPKGTPKGNGMVGTPMGRNDPKEVFKVVTLNNEKVLRVTGEIYGALTTNDEYENYHLHLQYKWGSKKWEPRLNLPRDMGIMFHLTGTNEDAFWSVFMLGLEFQISEGSTGDLFLVTNKTYSIFPVVDVRFDSSRKWDVTKAQQQISRGHISRSANFESDSAEWTTLDLYTIGGSAVYLVNGRVVMAFENAGLLQPDKSITPLTKGKIQLQSEAAEAYYKDITIQKITDYPPEIKAAAGLTLSEYSTNNSNIRHSVIFKFKPRLSRTEKQQFFNAAQKLGMIEGVKNFEVLKQVSFKNKYEYGFSMEFDNAEDYQKYNLHPEHSLFLEKYWQKYVKKFLEIDYEPITNFASFKF